MSIPTEIISGRKTIAHDQVILPQNFKIMKIIDKINAMVVRLNPTLLLLLPLLLYLIYFHLLFFDNNSLSHVCLTETRLIDVAFLTAFICPTKTQYFLLLVRAV